jgi:hypothetical protein
LPDAFGSKQAESRALNRWVFGFLISCTQGWPEYNVDLQWIPGLVETCLLRQRRRGRSWGKPQYFWRSSATSWFVWSHLPSRCGLLSSRRQHLLSRLWQSDKFIRLCRVLQGGSLIFDV